MKVKFKIQKITNELRYNDVMIIDLRLFHEKSRVVSITSWWQLLVLQCLKPLYLEGRYCCLIVFFFRETTKCPYLATILPFGGSERLFGMSLQVPSVETVFWQTTEPLVAETAARFPPCVCNARQL